MVIDIGYYVVKEVSHTNVGGCTRFFSASVCYGEGIQQIVQLNEQSVFARWPYMGLAFIIYDWYSETKCIVLPINEARFANDKSRLSNRLACTHVHITGL